MKNNDLNQIRAIVKTQIDGTFHDLEQKMFDWRSEVINSVDILAKEIRDGRELRDISGHQTASNTRRIEKLEKKVFGMVDA